MPRDAGHQKPFGAVITIVAVAAAVWAFYAWKHVGPPDAVNGAIESTNVGVTEDSNSQAVPSSHEVPDAHTASLQPDSTVRANAPASVDADPVEMTLNTPAEPAPATAAVPTVSPSAFGDNAARALKTGRDALAAGELIKSRAALSRAFNLGVGPSDQDFIRRELTRISDAMLFGRAVSPDDPLATMHTVKAGESLFAIASRYKISEDFIMTINGIKDRDMIWAGAKIKVVRGPFSAKIYKSAHRLDLCIGDVYIRSYPVGLGTDGGTPTGEWIIKNKLKNPDWSDPASGRYYTANDPENPIGERWISLECVSGDCMGRIGFGIHGTIDPKSIGADRSMGCVRLNPDDVAWLFDLLVQKYSHITILP